MAWLIFGLMTGALLCAFRAAVIALLSWDALRRGIGSALGHEMRRTRALYWTLCSAGCLVALAVMGLWRLAGWVAL